MGRRWPDGMCSQCAWREAGDIGTPKARWRWRSSTNHPDVGVFARFRCTGG
jgi:hypothetical protein